MPRSTAARIRAILACFSSAGRSTKAHAHAAEPDRRDLQAILPECALLHTMSYLTLFYRTSGTVLLIADMFHPIDNFAILLLLDGDVGHAVAGEAPCQCFSPGANQTTSPGRISSIGPPSR